MSSQQGSRLEPHSIRPSLLNSPHEFPPPPPTFNLDLIPHLFLQIIDGDDGVEGEVKEKLCGDLSSWIPISAVITQIEAKSGSVNYVRNITVK